MEFILTVMADDRPGIAEKLARTIEDNHGNWLESRMATMAGKFAGIIRIELPENSAEAAKKALSSLKQDGISIHVEQGETVVSHLTEHSVEIVGNDRPGIVREITNTFARLNINVIDLHTELEPAQMSGGLLFRAGVEFALADGQSLDTVIAALEELSPDLMVDE